MNAEEILAKYSRQAVKSATKDVVEYAQTHHEFIARTGKLEQAIVDMHPADGLTGVVTIDRTKAPYGYWVHQGIQQEYTIVPRHKKALRWAFADRWQFAKRVVMPQREGDPFLFNALKKREPHIQKIFDERIEEALREIAKEI